jgi:hypothetical protein
MDEAAQHWASLFSMVPTISAKPFMTFARLIFLYFVAQKRLCAKDTKQH